MAEIVIIGAGLTGLSAAYHLEQNNLSSYQLFEKESHLGGLCGSVQQDGFTFDYTGHLLHINDNYVRDLVDRLIGFEHFNTITRRSFIYSHSTYTPYPYQTNLSGLPTSVIADCIAGFITRPHRKKSRMFTDWVHSSFGSGFGKHFFFPYQQKIFACNIKELTASWTGRFVPATTLEQIIEGITQAPEKIIGYNAQFYYPKRGGILSWVTKFAEHIKQPIAYEHTIKQIDAGKKEIIFANGQTQSYKTLVTTIPLDQLLNCLSGSSTTDLVKARRHLRCNQVINFNLGITRSDVSNKHWIYFPEKDIPFYRIGFPHNFSDSMAPAGCSSLYGEFAHIDKSERWIKKTLSASIAQTKALLELNDDEIITKKIIPISHAYVIYDRWRDKNIAYIHKRLRELGIYSIGRYGEWKYASMQEALLDGKQVIEQLMVMPAQALGPATRTKPTRPRHNEIQTETQ